MIIFREKNANIVVVEKNLEARNLLVNSIRSMGFTSVTSTDQVRYVVENQSSESVPQWILCPLQTEERIHALQLLRLIEREKSLSKTCLSLLLTESEMDCVDYAFAHGMLSWHRRLDSPAATRLTFKTFFEMAKDQKYNSTMIAAQGISAHLKKARRYSELSQFYLRMVSCLPQESSLLFGLAESQLFNEQRAEAIHTLSGCSFYELSGWKEMAARFLKTGEFEQMKSPLQSLLIAHSDEHALALLAGHAENLGAERILRTRWI